MSTPTDDPKTAPPTTSEEGGAVFDFSDLQALREEYEERIRELEAEAKDHQAKEAAAVDAVKKDYEARLAAEGRARQELIESLSYELAGAREDGELLAKQADRRRAAVEDQLSTALIELERIEGDLHAVKQKLVDALAPGAAQPTYQSVAIAQTTPQVSAPQAASPAPAKPAASSPTPVAPAVAAKPAPSPVMPPSSATSKPSPLSPTPSVMNRAAPPPVPLDDRPGLEPLGVAAPPSSTNAPGLYEDDGPEVSQKTGPAWSGRKRKIRLR